MDINRRNDVDIMSSVFDVLVELILCTIYIYIDKMDKSRTIHEIHKITRLSKVLSVIPTNWGKKDMKKNISLGFDMAIVKPYLNPLLLV